MTLLICFLVLTTNSLYSFEFNSSALGSVEDALSSLLLDERSRQTKSLTMPPSPLLNTQLPESPDVPPLPDSTMERQVAISSNTRKIVSAHKGPESLDFFEKEVEEDGKSFLQYKEIRDASGNEILYTSTVRPEHLSDILSVTLDNDGYIESVDFKEDLEKHQVSDFLKARFWGINLEDSSLPPISVPTPQPFPTHFVLKAQGHRFSQKNVKANPNNVVSNRGTPPAHDFAAHFYGECSGCKHSKYDAGLVEEELLAFAHGTTRDLKIQMQIKYARVDCVISS